MQHGVEDLAAPDGRIGGVDQEDAALGDDGEPIGPVGVEHVTCRSVQHPAVGVAVGRNAFINGRTGLLRVEAVADQRRELRQRRQERRGIRGAAKFFQNDREFDRVLRVGQFGPPCVDVGLPKRRRVDSVLGHLANQRRRALFSHCVAHGVLPQPLIRIELE